MTESQKNRVIVIAEAGVNHNGDKQRAMDMVVAARNAGADYVKFQTFIPELVVSEEAPMADYQVKNVGEVKSQLEMLSSLALSYEDFREIASFAENTGIKFLTTAFDMVSLSELRNFNLDFVKIPSGEITNLPYIEECARLKKPIIISTGMADLKEVEAAVQTLFSNGVSKKDITVLHCNTEYPTPMSDVNLRAMSSIAEHFDVKIGYSDHTSGIEVAIAAVAIGATVIEKHFTMDKSLPGPDHRASLDPIELKGMVDAIRNIELALGDGIKKPSKSEAGNIKIARRSIMTASDLESGHILKKEDLIMKRPGDGISPMQLNNVIGKTLLVDKRRGTKINWSDLS